MPNDIRPVKGGDVGVERTSSQQPRSTLRTSPTTKADPRRLVGIFAAPRDLNSPQHPLEGVASTNPLRVPQNNTTNTAIYTLHQVPSSAGGNIVTPPSEASGPHATTKSNKKQHGQRGYTKAVAAAASRPIHIKEGALVDENYNASTLQGQHRDVSSIGDNNSNRQNHNQPQPPHQRSLSAADERDRSSKRQDRSNQQPERSSSANYDRDDSGPYNQSPSKNPNRRDDDGEGYVAHVDSRHNNTRENKSSSKEPPGKLSKSTRRTGSTNRNRSSRNHRRRDSNEHSELDGDEDWKALAAAKQRCLPSCCGGNIGDAADDDDEHRQGGRSSGKSQSSWCWGLFNQKSQPPRPVVTMEDEEGGTINDDELAEQDVEIACCPPTQAGCCPPNRCMPLTCMVLLFVFPILLFAASICLVGTHTHMTTISGNWEIEKIRMKRIRAGIEASKALNIHVSNTVHLRDQLRQVMEKYLPISESLGTYNASETHPETLCGQIAQMREAEIAFNATASTKYAESVTGLAAANEACKNRNTSSGGTDGYPSGESAVCGGDQSPFPLSPELSGNPSTFTMAGWNLSTLSSFKQDLLNQLVSGYLSATQEATYIITIPGRLRISAGFPIRNYSEDLGDEYLNVEWIPILQPPAPVKKSNPMKYRVPYVDYMYVDSNQSTGGSGHALYPNVFTATRKAQEFDLYILQNCSLQPGANNHIAEDYNNIYMRLMKERLQRGSSTTYVDLVPGYKLPTFFTNVTQQSIYNTASIDGRFIASSPPLQTFELFVRHNMSDYCEFYNPTITRGRLDTGEFDDATYEGLSMVGPYSSSHEVSTVSTGSSAASQTTSTFSRTAHRTYPDFFASRQSPLFDSTLMTTLATANGAPVTIVHNEQRITIPADAASKVEQYISRRVLYFPEFSRLLLQPDNTTSTTFGFTVPLIVPRRTYLNASAPLSESSVTLNGATPTGFDPGISYDVLLYVTSQIPLTNFVAFLEDDTLRASKRTVLFIMVGQGVIISVPGVAARSDSPIIHAIQPRMEIRPADPSLRPDRSHCLNFSGINKWHHTFRDNSNSYINQSNVDENGVEYLPPNSYLGHCFPNIADISTNLRTFYENVLADKMNKIKDNPTSIRDFQPVTRVVGRGRFGDSVGTDTSELTFNDVLGDMDAFDVISVSHVETIARRLGGVSDISDTTLCDNSTADDLILPDGTMDIKRLMKTCAFAQYSWELQTVLVSVTPGGDIFGDLSYITRVSFAATAVTQCFLLVLLAWQVSVFSRHLAALATRIGRAATAKDITYIEELSSLKELRVVQLIFVTLATKLRVSIRAQEILAEMKGILERKRAAQRGPGELAAATPPEVALADPTVEVQQLTQPLPPPTGVGATDAHSDDGRDEMSQNSDAELAQCIGGGGSQQRRHHHRGGIGLKPHSQGLQGVIPPSCPPRRPSTTSHKSSFSKTPFSKTPFLLAIQPHAIVNHSLPPASVPIASAESGDESQSEPESPSPKRELGTTPPKANEADKDNAIWAAHADRLAAKNRKQIKLLGLGSPLNPLVSCPVTVLRIAIDPHRIDANLLVLRELIPVIQDALVSKPAQLLALRREHRNGSNRTSKNAPAASPRNGTSSGATSSSLSHAAALAVDGIIQQIDPTSITIVFLPLLMLRALFPHRYNAELFEDYEPSTSPTTTSGRSATSSLWTSTPSRAYSDARSSYGASYTSNPVGCWSSPDLSHVIDATMPNAGAPGGARGESLTTYVMRVLEEMENTPITGPAATTDAALKALIVASTLQESTKRGSMFSYYASFFTTIDTDPDALVDVKSLYQTYSQELRSATRNSVTTTPLHHSSNSRPDEQPLTTAHPPQRPVAVGSLLVPESVMNSNGQWDWHRAPPHASPTCSSTFGQLHEERSEIVTRHHGEGGRTVLSTSLGEAAVSVTRGPDAWYAGSHANTPGYYQPTPRCTATTNTKDAVDGSAEVAGIRSVTLNPDSTPSIDEEDSAAGDSRFGEYIGVGNRGSSIFESTWGPSVHPSLLPSRDHHMAEEPTLHHSATADSSGVRPTTANPVEVEGGPQTSLVRLYNHQAIYEQTNLAKRNGACGVPNLTITESGSEIPSSSFRGVLFLPRYKQQHQLHTESGDLSTTTSASYPTLSSHQNVQRPHTQVGGGMTAQPTPHVLTPIIVLTSATEVTDKVSKLQVHRLKSSVIITDRVAAHVPSRVLRFSAPVDCVELQASYVGPNTASKINHAVYKHYHIPALEARLLGVSESASPIITSPQDVDVMMFSRSFDLPSAPQAAVSKPSLRSPSAMANRMRNANSEHGVTSPGGTSALPPPKSAQNSKQIPRIRAIEALRAEFHLEKRRSPATATVPPNQAQARAHTSPPPPRTGGTIPSVDGIRPPPPPYAHQYAPLFYGPGQATPIPPLCSVYRVLPPSTAPGSPMKKKLVKVKKIKKVKRGQAQKVDGEATEVNPRSPAKWEPPQINQLKALRDYHEPPENQEHNTPVISDIDVTTIPSPATLRRPSYLSTVGSFSDVNSNGAISRGGGGRTGVFLRDVSSSSDENEEMKVVEGLPTERRVVRFLDNSDIPSSSNIRGSEAQNDAGLALTSVCTMQMDQDQDAGGGYNVHAESRTTEKGRFGNARSSQVASTVKGHAAVAADLLRRGGESAAAASAYRSQAGPPSDYFGGGDSAYIGNHEEMSLLEEPYNISFCGAYITIRTMLYDPFVLSLSPAAAHSLMVDGTTTTATHNEQRILQALTNQQRQRLAHLPARASLAVSLPPLPPLRPLVPPIRLQQFQQAFRMLVVGNYVGAISFIDDLMGGLHRCISDHTRRTYEYEDEMDAVIRSLQGEDRDEKLDDDDDDSSDGSAGIEKSRSTQESETGTADALRAHRAAHEGAAAAAERRIHIDQDDAVAPIIRLVGHLSRWKRIASLQANQRQPYVRKETPQFENSKSMRYLLGR